jgi:hypothetical protein
MNPQLVKILNNEKKIILLTVAFILLSPFTYLVLILEEMK